MPAGEGCSSEHAFASDRSAEGNPAQASRKIVLRSFAKSVFSHSLGRKRTNAGAALLATSSPQQAFDGNSQALNACAVGCDGK
jgi:hypothetical protein